MFALFEDAFLIPLFPQAYSLRLLRQRLWTFAAFDDGNTFLPHTLISTTSSSQEMNIYAKIQTKMHNYTTYCYLHFFTQYLLIILQSVSKYRAYTYSFQSWYFSLTKPLVSRPETHAFTPWNLCFHTLKPMLSDCNLMPFRKRYHCV